MNQDNWINSILESTNNIRPVRPNETLFDRINLEYSSQHSKTVSIAWTMSVAAGLALLIGCNLFSIIYFSKETAAQNMDESQMLVRMLDIQSTNQIYYDGKE